jgi:antitoxin component YwqK of YwqJK toxin-antitoxin module
MLKELGNIVDGYLRSYSTKILNNGDVKRIELYGGIKNGLRIISIIRNGILICRCEYRNEIAHGLYESWYNDGTPKSKTIYEFGLGIKTQRWLKGINVTIEEYRQPNTTMELVI